ncbi:MAG: DUF3857 and transglutaminase domain-containing protein [candidate division Zixibacteria bacterium]|nr:DUF3857 and transglutaminase domain-containing protein [candidate division Zixibacteria bacterium]
MKIASLVLIILIWFSVNSLGEEGRIVYRKTAIEFDGKRKKTSYNVRLKIISESALDDSRFSSLAVPYNGKIEKAEVIITDTDLNTSKYKLKDAKQVTSTQSSTLASDHKVYYWDFGNVNPGSTIDYFYKIKDNDACIGDYFKAIGSYPVDTVHISIKFPSKKWRLKYSLDNNEPQYFDADDTITFSWYDLPALEDSDFEKAPRDFRPGLWQLFESKEGKDDFSSWDAVHAWSQDFYEGNESFKAARGILAVADDDTAIYSAIIEKCRYVAVEIGEGRFCPPPPGEVWRKGYGDCKGLANLFISRLKLAGYNAWPVLVQADDSYLGNVNFPSPFQFNHVITAYQSPTGDTIYQDMTVEYLSLGCLPISLHGCFALPIVAGCSPFRLDCSTHPPDTFRYLIEGELNERGKLIGTLDNKIVGHAAMVWSWIKKSSRSYDWETQLSKSMERILPKAALDNMIIESAADNELAISFDISYNKFGYRKDDAMIIRPWVLSFLSYNNKGDSTRTWPTTFQRNIIYEVAVRLHVQNCTAADIPDSIISDDNEFYDFRLSNTSHGDSLIADMELCLPPVILDPDQYNQYVQSRRQFARDLKRAVRFIASDMK